MVKFIHLRDTDRYIAIDHILWIDVKDLDREKETARVVVYFALFDPGARGPVTTAFEGKEAYALLRTLHRL